MKQFFFSGPLCLLLSIIFHLNSATTTPCALRATQYGLVCVCNATYCDYLDPVNPAGENDVVLISSSKAGLRFSTKEGQFSNETVVVKDWVDTGKNSDRPMVVLNEEEYILDKSPSEATTAKRLVTIKVDRSKQFQNIVGFGGAFTGAVSHNLEQISEELQDAVYQSYYSQKGIGFNMMRMSIGGCDFDLSPWAYNEVPENDEKLTNFTELDPRDQKKIEQIKRLKSIGDIDDIKIMAAAWSAPRWMKTNNAWTGYGFLKKEFYQTWANYHLNYLELMDANDMPIWGISTGNEPMDGFLWFLVRFMSLGWTPKNQAIWLADNFGPTLRNSKYSDIKIFSNDDQRYTYPSWFLAMNASRRESLDYIDGLSVHSYADEYLEPSMIEQVKIMLPNTLLFNTETCMGAKPLATHAPELGSWKRGERYAFSYFQDLQHSFNGYIDWNIILDEQGGPNYANNFVDAPIIVNVTSGEELYKQPMFYAIGHFSKFIPEGSIRIEAQRSNINILTAAFQQPNGRVSAVFFNSARVEVDVTLADTIRGNIVISIPPQSLHTIVYN